MGEVFNMVSNRRERTSEYFLRVCAEKFEEILDKLDLMDLYYGR